MRIKRFTAFSLKEATDQMRRELGAEAIILNTRNVPRSGAGSRESYELTAAIDDTPAAATAPDRTSLFGRYLANSQTAVPAPAAPPQPETTRAPLHPNRQESPRPPAAVRPVPRQAAEAASVLELRSEMDAMRDTLQQISDHLRYAHLPELPPLLREAYSTLVENDVCEELARQLILTAHSSLSADQSGRKSVVQQSLLHAMAGLISVAGVPRKRRRKTRIAALVGPTGVGKTTTVAKLAAIEKLVNRKKVALISTDTYRIGAIEQLRTFAAIADIPMEVVYRTAEMAPALRRFRQYDTVFVDTVGRSHRSKKEIAELARFVEAADPDETHLVLSASTSLRASREIIDRFTATRADRLLFTKLDEAASLGGLLSLLYLQRLPITWVTTGQTVPDDIIAVEPLQLASMVLTGAPAHA